MRRYHDAGHLAGIAQQALALMESMSVDDRIIKTEPEEDSPMSGMPSCGPSHTNAYFSPGSSIIKTEPEEEDSPMSGIPPWEPSYTNAYFAPRPSIITAEPEEEEEEEDSTMSGLNGLPPINPSNPPEFGYGGFHGDDWEDWMSQRMRNYPRTQIVQQQQTPSDDDDEDQNLFASSRSLAAVPDPLPMDIKVEEEARILDVFGNRITLSAWGLPASHSNTGYEYSWPSTPRGLTEPVFYGTVHQEPSHEATERAGEIHGAGSSLSHIVMWTSTSTSCRTHGDGYAVASLFNGEGWRVMCRREEHSIGRLWTSLRSISLAVEVALHHVMLWQPTPLVGTTVRIFTSDICAIKALKSLPRRALGTPRQTISVLGAIAAMSQSLSELGATLEVFWAPRANHPGYKVARAASVFEENSEDWESWAFPDESEVVEAMDEDASANIKEEMEERVKTEVKAEVKTEVKTEAEIKAQVKDDDDDMSFLDLRAEKGFEVDSKWWQRLSCC